ncbi:MAG: ABC transporter ATP-binding protein [Candidatus Lokiarchaeota archaeon]|nr:ABC transporter ATP-binding protein [Candidatus Lokiarchaeota archaeon]
MQKSNTNTINTHYVEFSPGKDPFEKARRKGPRRWILKHIFHGSNKILFIIVLVTTIIASNLSSIIMIIIGSAISDFLVGDYSSLFYYTTIILLLSIGTPIMRLANYMLREVIAQRMERDCRREFYANLLGKSQSFHEQQKIGDLMARVTDDVRMLNFLISPALSLIFESFTSLIVPLIYITIFYPPQLIFAPLMFSILFLFFLRSYVRKLGPITGRLRGSFGMMNATLNETLTGIEVVKGTVQEAKELEKYYSKAKWYRDAYIEQGKIQAKYLPILILSISMTLAFAHAIILNFFNLMSIGEIIAYYGLIAQLRFPTFISIFVFAIVRLAITSSERLLDLMNRETEIDENIQGIKKVIEGEIKFEGVSFTYPESKKPILKTISFTVQPGQTVAIVGTTGSGKSTLTKLISRLYDVNEGKILIDNIDIREYALESLRSQISFIEQDVFLFSDTIFNNISFGRTSSMDEIIQVANEAQANEFIMDFPSQYESEVGERGVQLSGGERQRIAIARAFLSDPKILILDDSTSAIDSNTEDKIQRAIRNILKDRTTILITHRLSQIRWADLIIVLRKGEISAMGTHEDLLKSSKEYRKIFIKKFDIDINTLIKQEEVS